MQPNQPIRLVVGFPPGSQTDTVARLLGQKFAEAWGKPIVVDNVTGAAGNIAADLVAKGAPNGYTLGLLSQTQLLINPSLYKLAYDPVKDFAPVSQVTVSPNMLVVHNALPAKSVKELVALAKARPGELTFVSSGSGCRPSPNPAIRASKLRYGWGWSRRQGLRRRSSVSSIRKPSGRSRCPTCAPNLPILA